VRFGQPLPARIQNAPELWLGNRLYYDGFLDLTSSRPVSMALGPLSILTLMEYCYITGIEGDQRDDFIWIITHLDAKYLEWSANRGHAK